MYELSESRFSGVEIVLLIRMRAIHFHHLKARRTSVLVRYKRPVQIPIAGRTGVKRKCGRVCAKCPCCHIWCSVH